MDSSEIFEAFDEAQDAAQKVFHASLAESGQRYALRAGREASRVVSHVTDWYRRVTGPGDPDTESDARLVLAVLKDMEKNLREAQRATLEYQRVIDDAVNLVCMARQKMNMTVQELKNE